jgi:hypothetical protein
MQFLNSVDVKGDLKTKAGLCLTAVRATAPTDTNYLWLDTNEKLLKFYNGLKWESISSLWD